MLLTENEISSILNFWFPNDSYNAFWFDKSVDEKIYKEYYHLLFNTYNTILDRDDLEFSYEENLALIILFDQFSRNINRIITINVSEMTNEARKLSLICIKNKYYLNKKMNHICFMLMPLRHLNKLTDKTFTDMKTQIIDILNSLEHISAEEMTRIGNIIFEIASNNKFYSKLYADIYTELIRSFDIMEQIFQVNYNTYLLLFDNIEYMDSEKDYNKFCIINKQNESRRAISTFFINLSLNGIIDSKNILSILKNLLETVLTKIKQENNKNEVDELTENIAILYNKNIIQLFEKNYQTSINDCTELYINGDTIVQTIKKLSEIKVKCYPSMSSKTIFKFMDMV